MITDDRKIFLASYLFNDEDGSPEWTLLLDAKDFEEAKLRIKAIKDTLKLDGELEEIIDADNNPE